MKRIASILSLLVAVSVAVNVLAGSDTEKARCAEWASDCAGVRKENVQLKQEIAELKLLLVRNGIALPGAASGQASGVNTGSSTQQETLTHWMTYSSSKRHNRGCRYFRSSNGRMCKPTEGIACKICGG